MEAYKHCFYDKSSGNIYLRTVADEQYQKIPYQKDYWVKDPTGKSPITDLYGVPMVRKTKYDKKVVDSLKSNGVAVAESDLREEVKYMHSDIDTLERIDIIDEHNTTNVNAPPIPIALDVFLDTPKKGQIPKN